MGLQALTIEDSSIVRKILRERLKRAGWDVSEASNASEGWELFQSLRPQLVTLDIVMPSMQGLDALSLLERMRKATPKPAVIIVSGSNSIDDRDKFMAAGAMAFVSKPFVDFEKLLDRFGRLFPVRNAPEVGDPEPIAEDLRMVVNQPSRQQDKRWSMTTIFISASIAAFALATIAYYFGLNRSVADNILDALQRFGRL
jgi:two-component system, chemotaxis family, chemotaxis protein CheY